jgi:hypothetical protein
MWCPSCGSEFREGYTRCDECDLWLVAERPAVLSPRRRARWGEDEEVEYDLSAWPPGRRQNLDAWIFADNIPAAWETETLLVAARSRAHEIDDLIAFLESSDATPVPDDPPPSSPPELEPPPDS